MLGRRPKVREVGLVPEYLRFAPDGVAHERVLELALDELEAIRLIDLLGLDQQGAASRMGVARSTVASIYDRARKKVADFLVNGGELVVGGGNVRLRPGMDARDGSWALEKGERTMRIAVTYEDGKVFQHFGRTEQFKVYEVEGGKVTSSRVLGSNGVGHGALAGLLSEGGVDLLVCGGIGGGAQAALARAGIEVYPGQEGDADAAVDAYLSARLVKLESATCNHHDHEHGHGCGSHEGDCGGHDHEGGCCH